jgi:hypothetical protein
MPAKARRKPKDDIPAEIDFSGGRRGVFLARAAKMTPPIYLDPDVAAVFQTSASVNAALRALTKIPPAPKPARRRKAS